MWCLGGFKTNFDGVNPTSFTPVLELSRLFVMVVVDSCKDFLCFFA